MNIGIDIDDTLSILTNHKLNIVESYIKKHQLPYQIIDKNCYLIEHMVNWDKHSFKQFWNECRDEIFNQAPIREFAKETIAKLKQDGHNITIITARSTKSFADPLGMSVAWLNENGIEYDELLVSQEDKSVACTGKNIHIFVEDHPDYVNQVAATKTKILLMHNPHNETYENANVTRVHNWQEVYQIIQSIS